MGDVRDADLADLITGVISDAHDLVEVQVSSIKTEVQDRLLDLGSTIKSWLIVVCVAIVTTILLAISLAATLTQVAGLPWYVSLWIVTAAAGCTVGALIYRAFQIQRPNYTAVATLQQIVDSERVT